MTKESRELRQQNAARVESMEAIYKKAEVEKRELTVEEVKEFEKLEKEFDSTDEKIQNLERIQRNEQRQLEMKALAADSSMGEKPEERISVGADREAERPFSFGEFLQAVKRNCFNRGDAIEKRLRAHQQREYRTAGDGSTEGIASEGGFLVGTVVANELFKRTYANNQILPRCAQRTITSGANSIELPAIDETSRATGSRFGGVRVYWKKEEAELTASKPAFAKLKLEVDKVTGLYYASDEVLEDATILEQEVTDCFVQEFDFKIQDGIVNGEGTGEPLGILNAACLVSVAKENGQKAATILYDNVLNMWARMWAASRINAAWFINQDIEPQLAKMALVIGTGGAPVYLPASGASGSPFGTLFGRPVIPIEQCQTLGTVGDIILADFSQYVVATKGAMKSAMSIHVMFVYAQTAFRWLIRLDGKPRWTSALTPYKGSNTLSPFIALATRA